MKAYGLMLAVVVAGCGGETGRAETPGDATESPPAVLGASDVAQVTATDLVSGVPVSGTLDPAVNVRIAAPIPEVVEEVLVREGDAVRKGQVLARFSIIALDPAAASAEAQRRIAAADFQRMKNLLAEGAVSQKDVENAELALRAAEATEAQARRRLDEAAVKAPVAGVVSQRLVESGNRVKDGDHLFQLVNTSALEFEATVPARYIADVRVGAPVQLAVSGIETQGVSGKVARVNASADPATRQVKVYVTVPNTAGRLVGGLHASGRVVLKSGRGVLAVPRTAIRTDDQGKTFVLVILNGRIERRDVTAGMTDEVLALIEITSGLTAGEMAIVGVASGLAPGDRVSLVGREG